MTILNKITPILDLTLLKQPIDKAAQMTFVEQAILYQVAALCFYPHDFEGIHLPSHIKRAAVINFPLGQTNQDQLCQLIDVIAHQKLADEIDYVFPYHNYLSGAHQTALNEAAAIIKYCHQYRLSIKVIVESECFSEKELFVLCNELINKEPDFIKTSTGHKPIGATLGAAQTILDVITDTRCGIKLSGGIKTAATAMNYIEIAEQKMQKAVDSSWFRIGSSQLLAGLLQTAT